MRTAGPRPRSGETLDTFYHGRVLVLQKKRGYRFSVDAALSPTSSGRGGRTKSSRSARAAASSPFSSAASPSGGSWRSRSRRGWRPWPAERRAERARGHGRGRPRGLPEVPPGAEVRPRSLQSSLYPEGRRLCEPGQREAIARHELRGGIGDLMRMTAEWLKPRGRACFVFPERRRETSSRRRRRAGSGQRWRSCGPGGANRPTSSWPSSGSPDAARERGRCLPRPFQAGGRIHGRSRGHLLRPPPATSSGPSRCPPGDAETAWRSRPAPSPAPGRGLSVDVRDRLARAEGGSGRRRLEFVERPHRLVPGRSRPVVVAVDNVPGVWLFLDLPHRVDVILRPFGTVAGRASAPRGLRQLQRKA